MRGDQAARVLCRVGARANFATKQGKKRPVAAQAPAAGSRFRAGLPKKRVGCAQPPQRGAVIELTAAG